MIVNYLIYLFSLPKYKQLEEIIYTLIFFVVILFISTIMSFSNFNNKK